MNEKELKTIALKDFYYKFNPVERGKEREFLEKYGNKEASNGQKLS